MAKKRVEAEALTQPATEAVPFTGIARSVVCYKTHNTFKNFKIVTLHIKDGIVWKVQKSDPYAVFEAGDILDLANDRSLLKLNFHWQDGKAIEANEHVYWEKDRSKK